MPKNCSHIRVGEVEAIVCGGKKIEACTNCGAIATLLCDWKIDDGKTCDAPLCTDCTFSPAAEKDLCPDHAKAWAEHPANAAAMTGRVVTCPYCDNLAILVDSVEVYRRSYGMIWICRPCQAWVGCHKNSKDFAPLGRLANAELREWKQRAHRAFDPLWQDGDMTRKQAYDWLTSQIGAERRVHIGWSDVDRCRQIVEACKS